MLGRRNPQLNIPIPARQQTQLYRLPLPPQTTAASKDVINLSELERIQIVGHGSGGKVYKVRHKKTSALYALKVIHCNHDETVRPQIIQEMEILKKTESPYIVKCYGIFERGEEIYFVLEYMDGGSLEQRKSEMMSESFLSNVARQVSEGLRYLHRHKIVHRDIKPSNLLINKKQEVKIADFGVSRILSQTLDHCNTYVGTSAYMSPERFDPETYGGRYDGYAGDIWSLGLSLLECYIGHFPFLARGQKPDWPALMCAICYGDPPSPPPTASANFRSFINCCLHKDARSRWTAAQLLSHPFILCSFPTDFPCPCKGSVSNPDWPTLMCAICYGDPSAPPPTATAQFRSFMTCCLHKDAHSRWTAAQLLGHPFLLCNYPQTPSIAVQRLSI